MAGHGGREMVMTPWGDARSLRDRRLSPEGERRGRRHAETNARDCWRWWWRWSPRRDMRRSRRRLRLKPYATVTSLAHPNGEGAIAATTQPPSSRCIGMKKSSLPAP